MDRASLEQLLGQGLSLAEIGRRVGRHEATVGYWLRKHGLQAVGRAKHAAQGGIGKEELEVLIVAGMSISEIAEDMNCSKGTVRHWLTRYGLKTHGAHGRRTAAQVLAGRTAGLSVVRMRCPRHGETNFCLDKRGYYRCKRCRSESVARRRRRMKEILVREAGGACQICGYDRDMRALHFHHLERSSKRHEINARGAGIALDKLRSEARKCVLLCANCHAEVEAGLIALAAADGAP